MQPDGILLSLCAQGQGSEPGLQSSRVETKAKAGPKVQQMCIPEWYNTVQQYYEWAESKMSYTIITT